VFTGHLIAPKEPKENLDNQLAETADAPKLCEKSSNQASPTLKSKSLGNVSIPTRSGESAESDSNPDSENFQFSQTLGKYVAYLKSIKHPKIVNSELLDGVDRVSRSIEGCIKLAESALDSTKI